MLSFGDVFSHFCERLFVNTLKVGCHHSYFSGVRVPPDFVCVMFYRFIVCLFVIALSVLLQFTASEYPFGIFFYTIKEF
jgi:hypothetical protein